jgi:hypothetical protein
MGSLDQGKFLTDLKLLIIHTISNFKTLNGHSFFNNPNFGKIKHILNPQFNPKATKEQIEEWNKATGDYD